MNRNGGGLVRRTCAQSAPPRVVWGHAPQKIFKIQGVSGAFWCDFGIYELRAQLTSAHTQTLRVRVAAAQKERAPLIEPHLPRRKCTRMRWAYTYLRTAVARVSSFKRPLIQGGATPVLRVLGGLQPPQPPRFLRQCTGLVIRVTSSYQLVMTHVTQKSIMKTISTFLPLSLFISLTHTHAHSHLYTLSLTVYVCVAGYLPQAMTQLESDNSQFSMEVQPS